MINSNKRLIIILSCLFMSTVIIFSIYLVVKRINDDKIRLNKMRKEIYEKAVFYCEKLYENGIVKNSVSLDEIDECINKIKLVYNKESVLNIKNEALKSKRYISVNSVVDGYYKDGVVVSSITMDNINSISNKSKKLDEKYRDIINARVDELKEEYNNIHNAQDNVHNLFSDYDNNIVSVIDRDKYNNVKTIVDNLKQQDIKNELNEKMEIVLKKVEEREAYIKEQQRIERERKEREEAERKKAINEAWVILNVPYISQNRNGVLNGCEAASMLMALQYKGYLNGMDLVTYSTNMPKSDDPNTGFYLDIFGKEPNNVAHYIAPNPLVNYGISSSGYGNIVNITGYSIDSIINEIISGNPVIIYLTYAYQNPYNWSNGAPKNLHVQLVIGYNKITKEFIIQDPWTRLSGQYRFTLSREKIANLYSSVGSRAIVVR